MNDIELAKDILDRAGDCPDLFGKLFDDICDVDDVEERTNGLISKYQARRLFTNRKTNGLEAAGAVIDKPGMRGRFVLSRLYAWLTGSTSEAA